MSIDLKQLLFLNIDSMGWVAESLLAHLLFGVLSGHLLFRKHGLIQVRLGYCAVIIVSFQSDGLGRFVVPVLQALAVSLDLGILGKDFEPMRASVLILCSLSADLVPVILFIFLL